MSEERAWTTAREIESKVERLWSGGRLLSARVRAEVLFPKQMNLSRPSTRALSDRFEEVRAWIRGLEEGSKAARGFGYDIVWETINHRQLGRNRVPLRVVVETESDALALIGKARAADRFSSTVSATLAQFPELEAWTAEHPLEVLDNADVWDRVLGVLAWFRAHPRSGLYLRQLDVAGVDTKFIEARKALLSELLDRTLPPEAVTTTATGARNFEVRFGLLSKAPLVRFRILDPSGWSMPLTDIATPAADFGRLDPGVSRVFITENEINGLAFPAVSSSMVVFGLGYGLERLAEVPWLRERSVHYWGDLDTHGFAMLDRLRAVLPHARSLLMDRATLFEHRALWTREPEPHEGAMARLTEDERLVYDSLKTGDAVGARLEQERIAFGWVQAALRILQ